jgi:glycosyltransferase involved in cell wall biosynthesis
MNRAFNVWTQFSKLLYVLAALVFFNSLHGMGTINHEKPMVIVIPSYKNIKWYESNLKSVFDQNYDNYRVIYLDDCSPDGTGEAVQKYIQDCHQENRVQLVRNTNRIGALANIYAAVHSCQEHEIIVLLDGDDKLHHDHVLSDLNKAYASKNVWFTHGTLMEYPWGNVTWCEPIPHEAFEKRNYRKFKCPSHLRTFYTWLFKKIKLQDFLYKGQFYPMAWDMAIMFPLAEMAEERHLFFEEPNYDYNMANPINDNKVDPALQNLLDAFIRNCQPYSRLGLSEIPQWMLEDRYN